MGTLGEIFGRTCRGGKKSGRKSSEIEIRFAVCKVERRTNSYQYVPTPFKYKNRHRVIFVQTSKVIREDFGFRILRCVIGRKKKLVPCYEPIRRPRFPALLVCLFFFSSIAHWLMMETFLMTARCEHFGQLQTTINIYQVYFWLATFFRTGLYQDWLAQYVITNKKVKHGLQFSVTQTKESLRILHSTNRRSYF